jgi:2'-5' RNA ligase
MTHLPVEFRDRWKNRTEPAPGFGTVYWHVLMSRYDGARSAAQDARDSLSPFPGFHLTPTEWLHMTTLMVGPAEHIEVSQLTDMISAASEDLASTRAIAANISRVLYHPEAVMLAVDPAEALLPLRKAAQAAARQQEGHAEPTQNWIPHMTVGYSVARQLAKPIIDRVGFSITSHELTIDRMTLVIQWGPERSWNWEPVGEISLASNAQF